MAMTPEAKVKEAVKKFLKSKNVWWFCPMQNGMGVSGIPDFICCVPPSGKFLAIETKAPGKIKNVSPNQEARIKEIQTARGIAIVLDDIKFLEEIWEDIQHGD